MNFVRALTKLRSLAGMLAVMAVMMGAIRAEVVKGPSAATPVSVVDLETTLRDAHRLAEKIDATVVRVEGGSMLPYFGDGSVLVVRSGSFANLRAGMVVVYRNRFGETVAHRLEARTEAGWTARGANNRASDSTLVTAENFVGSVYVTFHSNARAAAGTDIASLVDSTPVALAASAR